jgi:hypothetical protein
MMLGFRELEGMQTFWLVIFISVCRATKIQSYGKGYFFSLTSQSSPKAGLGGALGSWQGVDITSLLPGNGNVRG